MKSRKDVAEYINSGDLSRSITVETRFHFGLVELRLLMDFIYEGEPKEDEFITRLD